MLKGINITLYQKTQTGVDGFDSPIFEYIPTTVENVLVAPSTHDDIVTSTDLVGKESIYTIGIPKGDKHKWTDTIVEFFGEKYKTFGFEIQGIEENVPTRWHKKVMCERYE